MTEYTKAEQAIRNIQNLFPSDMIKRPQWVAWRSVRKPGDEEPTKVPIDPHNGDEAKTNDPKTWRSFERAARRYIANEGYAGIGYVYTKDDPYGGIDLDYCRDPETGVISHRATSPATTWTATCPVGASRTLLRSRRASCIVLRRFFRAPTRPQFGLVTVVVTFGRR